MSRIPISSSSLSSSSSRRPPPSPSKTPSKTTSRIVGSTPRPRTTPSPTPTPALRKQASVKNLRSKTPTKSGVRRTQPVEDVPPTPQATALSIREQIALKRAEAKKAMDKVATSNGDGVGSFEGLEDASPFDLKKGQDEVVDLGRWSVKETIERARSSGALNLASRSLPCLPSALFEIHLGITPEPLKSVPVEPPISTYTSDDPSARSRRAESYSGPSWYEAQDLEIIKAWSNEIVEIQPEISMFGSLKNIDLHNNKLTTLPESFADLTALTILNLSHNQLTSLPPNIYALPSLSTLDLSHNELSSLPFSAPFSKDSNPLARTVDPRGEWYSESITRATAPLPKLSSLDISHNRLSASSIDHESGNIPSSLTKLDLSFNPLGSSKSLIRALSHLENLQELRFEHASIGDDSFPVDILHSNTSPYPRLHTLDLGETHVTLPVIEAAFLPNVIHRTLDFEITNEPPRDGTLRVIIGKKVVKEAWEAEAERRTRMRAGRHVRVESVEDTLFNDGGSTPRKNSRQQQGSKESWEIEAAQGLFTEGARRRARAVAAAQQAPSSTSTSSPSTPATSTLSRTALEKEAWEIEAEQGLLTAGGRRRARALAAATALSVTPSESSASSTSTPATSPIPSGASTALSHPQYYSPNTQTLTLPPSTLPSKALHSRSFSLAAKSTFSSPSMSDLALAIPTPTLPLASILTQPFSHTLTTLVLNNRRMDPSFFLPADHEGPFLPHLEELRLEGCNLGDSISVSRSQEGGGGELSSSARTNELLLPLIAKLFPSLQTLDLSYNNLTSDALASDVLSELILASDTDETPEEPITRSSRKGLRHLRLRGNKLSGLDGLQHLAEMFKCNRDLKGWKLEELDLRDNAIDRLPAEIGLLPLDVLLVEGNVFRVPKRTVWEREGTKGLLSWLRGRME